ncbi:MAG: hypothetical protein Q4D96_09255 [Propionibacteriaceae bacterium]|nr:hypothetical protein [Propionibacteriaceae bacterium]
MSHPLAQLGANTILWVFAALVTAAITAWSARRRQAALRPTPHALPPGACPTARERAEQAINQLREQLGQAQTSLELALEAPGLFDINFPATKRFWEAMTQWEDSHLRLTGAEALTRAQALHTLWEDTVAAAQIAGDGYLASTDRISLKTARGLVAKAASTTSNHEREALMAKVAELLAKLNLALLGRDTIAAITTALAGSIDAPPTPAVA